MMTEAAIRAEIKKLDEELGRLRQELVTVNVAIRQREGALVAYQTMLQAPPENRATRRAAEKAAKKQTPAAASGTSPAPRDTPGKRSR